MSSPDAPVPRCVARCHESYAQSRERLPKDNWSLSILEGPDLYHLAPAPGCAHPVLRADQVTDTRAGFLADPFWLRTENLQYLFFEVFNYKLDRGEIALAVSADGYRWEYQRVVMREAFHLSFPMVFEDQGEFFMIPETHGLRAVNLYRASRFPTHWVKELTLLSGHDYVDPAMIKHNGRRYLFLSDCSSSVLYLFHSRSLAGEWKQHPASPVLSADPLHARPAGRFVHDGKSWIRFAQSSRPHYGAYISAFRIDELDEFSYRETRVEPYPFLYGSGNGWNSYGMHHVDPYLGADGRWRAIADGLSLQRRWPRRSWLSCAVARTLLMLPELAQTRDGRGEHG